MENPPAFAKAEAVNFDNTLVEALCPVTACVLPALVRAPVNALKHFCRPNPRKHR